MSDAIELAAGLLRQIASGKPIETDRQRVEHHMRRALRSPAVPILWEGSMEAATRRMLELLLEAQRFRERRCSAVSIPGRAWVPFGDTALDRLHWLDLAALDQGRRANRAANVTPRRRLAVSLDQIAEPVPAVLALNTFVGAAASVLLSRREPRGWRLLAEGHDPIEHHTRELAQAAAAGLMTAYRVDCRIGKARHALVLVPRPVLRVTKTAPTRWSGRQLLLHADDRPAVEWPDGTAVWFWNGVEIPRRLAEHLDELAPERVAAIRNQEVRRLVVERIGWERFLAGARRVAQDDFGTLWDAGVRLDGERLRLVEVVNATQEPDGTRRRYLLRVPPTTRTARQGVAWTFGYENADDYILAAAS